MVSRGAMSDDVSYVLLEPPLVPRLDLSDCRPTELPVLPETAASQPSPAHGPMHIASGQMSAPAEPRDRVPVLPRTPIGTVTEVKTVVVDMREIGKLTASPNSAASRATNSGRATDMDNNSSSSAVDSSNENDANSADETEVVPLQAKEKRAGVLKGANGDSSGNNSTEARPRHRVSFLLDAVPGQGKEDGGGQIRVFAKPPQRPPLEPQKTPEQHIQAMGEQHTALHQHRFANWSRGDASANSGEPTMPTKRFRPHGSADSRTQVSSAAYRQHIRQLQAEARLREAYAAAASRSVENYRQRHSLQLEDDSANSRLLPSVSQSQSSAQQGRRVPLFSFKRSCTMDTAPGAVQQSQGKEGRSRRNFMLPQNPGIRPVKGQVRFQDEDIANASQVIGESRLQHGEDSEYASLHARHVEPRHSSLRRDQLHNGLAVGGPGTDHHHHTRNSTGKPPIPRTNTVASLGPAKSSSDNVVGGGGYVRATSASSRSSGATARAREYLTVESLPSSVKPRQRPSTVSSASSSIRSREVSSAKQRIGSSVSRVSSASLKAASDPGIDLDNMDLVTLNLMARRAKGPSRYRYLAKLRSLNLNTPRPLA